MTDDDALMYAITGEPAPDDTPELRAARDDIAVLRAQLALIADELDDPPVVVPLRRRPLNGRLVLVGVAAAGVLGLLGGGLALLPNTAGDASSASDKAVSSAAEDGTMTPAPQSPLTDPEYLACAATVVEGTVSAVRPLASGETAVTLKVTHAYKPTPGPADVTFTFGLKVTIVRGTPVLVALRPDTASPDDLFVGTPDITAQRPALTRALADSRALTCPD
ncbi:hypothetical protein ABZX85_11240 [Streptomyces sp. NPDC004539]|uniref:hypothetical protein n=1 Tax=Streptomyces sp. NPDC004539 TaxID=3154280 RepID=UPI0033A1BC26